MSRQDITPSSFAVLLLLLLATALGSSGCRRDPAAGAPNRVTVASTDDATQPIVDEDYRFRLDWPGRGYKLLREADAAKLTPDAIAGVLGDGIFAALVVERLPGMDLAGYSAMATDNFQVAGKRVGADEVLEHGGHEARRVAIDAVINGVPFRFVVTSLQKGDMFYRWSVWSAKPRYDAAAFEALQQALSLLDGEVRMRARSKEVADVDGVGWRCRGGEFRSAASGLVAAPQGNWRLVVGDELATMNGDAEVGLIATDRDAYLVVITELAPAEGGDEGRAQLAERQAAALGFTGERSTVELAMFGQPREFVVARNDTGMEFVYHILIADGVYLQVLAWHGAGDHDRALAALPEALQAFSWMAAGERQELAEQLRPQLLAQQAVGPGYALRGGRYRDYNHGVTWTLPPGFWRVLVGDEARRLNEQCVAYVEDRALGVHAMLLPEARGELDADGFHETLVAGLTESSDFVPAATAPELAFESAPTRVSLGAGRFEGQQLQYLIASAVQGRTALQLFVWGRPGRIDAAAAPLQALARGLRFERELQEVHEADDAFTDDRLGYSLRLPAGWRREDQTPAPIRGLGRITAWSKGRESVTLIAMHLLPGQDEQWIQGVIEQSLRDRLGAQISGQPEEGRTTLGGEPARQLVYSSWLKSAKVVLLSRGKVYYALIATGKGSGLESAMAGFRFVP